MSADYLLIIPSRRRSDRIAVAAGLLPSALVTVEESEMDDYLRILPKSRLVPHPPLSGLSAVRQWILDNREERIVVQADDDLTGVNCMVGRKVRRITDPRAIERIIANGAQIASDLGVEAFCWGRNPNPMWFQPHRPIGMVGPVSNTWGIVGRSLRFDTQLVSMGDVDANMRALLQSRVIITDNRFYFDHGPIFTGSGGLQGIRTHENRMEGLGILKKRWGQYLILDQPSERGATKLQIRVTRRCKVATTGE